MAFVPNSWEVTSTSLEFPTRWKYLCYSQWAPCTIPVSLDNQKDQLCNQRVGALSHIIPAWPLGKEAGLKIRVQPLGQWLNQSCLYNKPTIKTLDIKAWVSFSAWQCPVCTALFHGWKSNTSLRTMKSSCLEPSQTLPCAPLLIYILLL